MSPPVLCGRLRKPRGFSTVEAMLSLVVLLVGMVGILTAQLVAARSSSFARRMSYGSALARDLAENMLVWAYTDPRISPTPAAANIIATASDTAVVAPRWDTGRTATPQACATGSCMAYMPAFTDQASGATAVNALATGGLMSNDLDSDGASDFQRYWNVYYLNTGAGVSGKLIQIFVRWKEPGFGYRTVSTMAFQPDPSMVTL